MKKKIILAGLLLTMCVGLTACGNPLKQLPEISEESIYNVEEETTGNEAADEIIDVLTDEDEGGVDGDVTSFMVYDRDDNEDSKEKSDVSVEIVIETDDYEYTGYYIVEMKYDDEDGWKVDEFVADEDEESICKPLEGVDEDIVRNSVGMADVTPVIGDVYEEDGIYYNDATVEYSYENANVICNMSIEIVYEFYFDESTGNAEWYIYEYNDNSVYEPLAGVDEDLLWDTIYYDLDLFYIDNREFYILSDNMGDITPLTNEIYEENGIYYNEMTVQFEYVDYVGSYIMEYYMLFEFNPGGYWELYDYEYPTSYELVANENMAEPSEGVDAEILYDTIYWELDLFYIDDIEFYILSDNMGEITPLTNDVYEENGIYYNELTVQFEYVDDDNDCSYIMEYYMLFAFDSYGEWELVDYEYPDSYELVEH